MGSIFYMVYYFEDMYSFQSRRPHQGPMELTVEALVLEA